MYKISIDFGSDNFFSMFYIFMLPSKQSLHIASTFMLHFP